MSPVILRGEFFTGIKIRKFSKSISVRIANPARNSALIFLYKKLGAVAPAITKNKFFIYIIAKENLRAFLVFDHVAHIFIIYFHAGFVPVILEITEITCCNLLCYLWFYNVAAWYPQIHW